MLPPLSREADAALDPRLLQEAAQWFSVLHFGDASEEDRARWNEWLGTPGSTQRQAWQRVELISGRFGAAGGLPGHQVLHAGRSSADLSRRKALSALAVLGGSALTAWLVSRTPVWENLLADLSTGVGEIRDTTLADGTRLWLNTDSAVEVRYDDRTRRLRLLRGEIRIVTASDPLGQGRPFVLDTSHGQLRPLGTRFNVRQTSAEGLLSVDKGAVEVQPSGNDAHAQVIAAGWQARFTVDGVSAPERIGAPLHGWAAGMLVADDMRLDTFLSELGRYRRGRLACDPAVAGLRLGGVYSVRDTDQALATLERTLPVRVRRYAPWWVAVVPA